MTATSDVPVRAAGSRLPLVVRVVAAGTFLMATSEFLVAGVLPEVADSFRIDVGCAGLAITVFAVGMIIGAPTMVLLIAGVRHRARDRRVLGDRRSGRGRRLRTIGTSIAAALSRQRGGAASTSGRT